MSTTNPKHGKHARPSTDDIDSAKTQAIPAVSGNISADETVAFAPVDENAAIKANKPAHAANPLLEGDATQALPTIGAADFAYEDAAFAEGGMAAFNMEPKKKRNGKKIAAIVGGSVVGVLLIVYIAVAVVFTNIYYPNTTVGSIDASLKSADEVAQSLSSSIDSYKLSVTGPNGFAFETSTADAGITMDAAKVAEKMHEAMPGWQWPVLLVKSLTSGIDCSDLISSSYNESGLAQSIAAAVLAFNETATQPTNATIAYDQESKQFKVQKEQIGTALDNVEVTKAIDAAISDLQPTLAMTDAVLLQPTVLSTEKKLATAAETANGFIKANITLLLDGKEAMTVDADVIAPFVQLSDTLEATLDEGTINDLATTIADGLNTKGSERTYTRPDGKEITVSGGVYGWEVDSDTLVSDIAEGIKNGETKTIDVPCTQEGNTWTGLGRKDWGNRYIDIDLAEQHVRMYDDNGSLIWESDCISGIPDGEHDTSVGVYYITTKASPQKLTGYSGSTKIYESYVTYWMPFDGNVIGLHDADWQPGFGGTMYRDGYGSHGCVNLPPSAAATLYQIVQVGDVVVSHW